ncbi:MAG: marine proteobacterial sortase target protein [Acidobacteria bacterium]|nr:marine proteobacterial sortase target protein [Acidobacteriota bacterium]
MGSELGNVTSGVLLKDGDKPLPLKHTDVTIQVTGLVATVQLEQVFTNPHQERIEAVYVFPLPADASVNDMAMKIGDRRIRSIVKEREEARHIYSDAKHTGRRATLLEQERPNIFTTSVANIGPGEEISIQIRYLQRLPYDDGGFRLSFPMAVGPRYIPGQSTGKQAGGWAPDTTAVPDASHITPPVLRPETRPGYDISVRVDLDAGVPIHRLSSPSHQITFTQASATGYHIELARLNEIPNKDFVFEYKLAGKQPQATVLSSRGQDEPAYFLLMVIPPIDTAVSDVRPKEATFIIDTSGSMSGQKITQAKNALRAFVHGLNPHDSFNIIRFASDFSYFSEESLPFTEESVERADEYIDRLSAAGGTEMLAPLQYALKLPRHPRRLPIIIFLTDGQVGNEAQILKEVQDRLGPARLFAFGVDTAPNDYLLRKLAEVGRGTFEFVLPTQNLEEVIGRFQNRIASPLMTNVAVDWSGLEVEDVYPTPIPDLFAAQPVVLYGKVRTPMNKTITLRGETAQGIASLPIRVDFTKATADHPTLAALWARARIEQLSDRLHRFPDETGTKEEIIRLALAHRLMSLYTAFVVVEEKTEPSSEGGEPRTIFVLVPLPEGWDYDAVFGPEPVDAIGTMYMMADLSSVSGPLLHAAPLASPARKVSRLAMMRTTAVHEISTEPAITLTTIEDRLQAVARYLLREQTVRGWWTDRRTTTLTAEDIQTTCLALLAYLGGGHTDRAGGYQAQVRRALDSLLGLLDDAGRLNGLAGQDEEVLVQALATWVMAESYAATDSERYLAAAENMLQALLQLRTSEGLWPTRAGDPSDIAATAWAALALKGCERAGLPVEWDKLTACPTFKALADTAPVEHALIQLLSGGSLEETHRDQLKVKLTAFKWTLDDAQEVEQAVRALILARLLDQSVLAAMGSAMLKLIVSKQVTQGKAAGSCPLYAGQPVAALARAYMLLSIGRARWAALSR